jgi:hypothetical protein
MRKRKPTALEWIEDQHRDLQGENELLRIELRKALNFEELRAPRIPATYARKKGAFRRHFVIPDTQVRPGVPTEHLIWAGRYIREKAQPGDVVVHLGDHWDFESLSSYDRGKKCFEGRRIKGDIDAGNAALALLTKELDGAKCELHLLRGNHEDRLARHLELAPEWIGVVGFDDLISPGWHVHDFLEVLELDCVLYSHYFYAPTTGRARGGTAANILRHVGRSFVQGHRQGLDVAMHQLPDGKRRRGIVCGSFYQHSEVYLGPQGDHWRGMLMLTEVQDGDFDVVEVSLDFLRRKYG